jgi:GDPmannose 4,6-dehydratase
MKKSAVITGFAGQDGSILAEQLINKDYKVYGLIRRSSRGIDLGCASNLQNNPNLEVVEGDLLDLPSLIKLCNLARPNLFFHAGAQSHVGTSFNQPVYTTEVNTIGTLNCLEAIRTSGFHTRFLSLTTSEMFGGVNNKPANEKTPFYPRSPYGVSKLASFWMTKNYRESYRMFACSSICFNHEEPGKRGPNFVTRKISIGVANIKLGKQDKLYLGNLDAKRDWGIASDFTKGMIMILESAEPDDYVLATGETHSVREFCELAFSHVGLDYHNYVEVDPRFYRPAEVHTLIGDYSKINRKLGWAPKTTFKELVKLMVDYDLTLLQKVQ